MKKFTKILSAGLSALMLIASSSIGAGAVSVNEYRNINMPTSIQGCSNSKWSDMKSVLNQVCSGGKCDIQSVMKMLQNSQKCPSGICGTPAQTTQTSRPSEPSQSIPAESAKPAVPSVSGGFNTSYEDEVIRLVNAERAKYGLSALKKDTGAVSVAHLRAKEIVQNFSHTRPDGTSCFTAAKELGVSYSTAGENIAYGYGDPEQVVRGWMNSEGHRKNILSASYSKIGTGCYKSGNTLYWSQFFIG